MAHAHVLSIKKDVSLVERPDAGLSLESAQVKLPLGPVSPGIVSAIKVLLNGGAREQELGDVVLEQDGAAVLPYLYLYLHQFDAYKFLCRTVRLDEEPLATLVPTSFYYKYEASDVSPDAAYTLSRFACCRREGDSLIVESPLGHARLVLHSPRAASLLAHLATSQSPAGLAEHVQGVTRDDARAFIDLLANAGALSGDEEPETEERASDASLRQWDFHDLFFHTRSRVGRHANPYGGTYRFVKEIEPLPAVKPRMSEGTIYLFKPDLDRLKENDPTFTSVLEDRKSVRAHGERALTAQQLGEFLFRAARVREIFKTEHGELGSRPYPAGGAIYELEIYPVVNRCEGIDAGLYHYRPDTHQLSKLAGQTSHFERLLEYARHTAVQESRPQVLLVVTARFQRVTWKYQSMAYALVLKHVGVLYQTMYLAGTAMGLATCALGGGDSDLFAEAAGLDYYAESSVGEFIIGQRPDSDSPQE
jgi:SagB-type dehydrogenase family enzyme